MLTVCVVCKTCLILICSRLRLSRSTEGTVPISSWPRKGTPVVTRMASLPSKMNLLRSGLSAAKDPRVNTCKLLVLGIHPS
ncbi:hypothetical protein EDD16DRAFT_1618048 [Pisolithus croceorrhizus]|nr:hypothetical protein EDD16DRAFT_1618048 [Pisolithus croceorrhizus]